MTTLRNEETSLIVAVKDRSQFLEKSLATWIKVRGLNQIIILDWSSEESLVPMTFPYGDKVSLFRVEDLDWKLTQALNVASCLVETEYMLKVDADTLLSESFLETHPLKKGLFYSGNWEIGETENDHHLNGIFYCRTEDFRKIHGYNEMLSSYGWDDSDLYQRLQVSLNRSDFDIAEILHQPHGDDLRLRYSSGVTNCAENIQKNRMIANQHPWSGPMSHPSKIQKTLRYTHLEIEESPTILEH